MRGCANPTRRQFGKGAAALGAAMAAPGWLRASEKAGPGAIPRIAYSGQDSLRAHAAAKGLLFGAAVDPARLDLDAVISGGALDPYTDLAGSQAGILVAENAMKWAGLRPTAETYDFSKADRLLQFARLLGQQVRGHNLCWHEALPGWFKTTATSENARNLLTQHIQVVAGRYRGKVHSWDVVNEAIEPEDGRADCLRKSPWLDLVGPDYIELAFRTAAQADPQARLVYNDYNIELDTPGQTAKRGQVLLLLRRLKARGVPIHAVGVQSHLLAAGPQPGAGLRSFIREVATMGLDAYITELDVNTRTVDGGPEAQDSAVAAVYRNYLGLALAEPNVPVVLTWGIANAHTWLNETREKWAVRPDGARQRPLPFDDDYKPTPAFLALRGALDGARPPVPGTVPPPSGAVPPAETYAPFAVPGSPGTEPAPPKPQNP